MSLFLYIAKNNLSEFKSEFKADAVGNVDLLRGAIEQFKLPFVVFMYAEQPSLKNATFNTGVVDSNGDDVKSCALGLIYDSLVYPDRNDIYTGENSCIKSTVVDLIKLVSAP